MPLKKILYITPGLPVGGAEKFLVSLTNALKNHTRKQIIVTLSDNNPLEHEFDNSIEVLKLPRQSKWSLQPVIKLRKCIQEEKPDIIFCLNFFSYFFARVAIMGISSKEKVYISYHSTIHLNKKEHLLHKFYLATVKKNYKILTVSENQAILTSSTYQVDKSLFKTIYNGVDTNYWRLPLITDGKSAIRQQLEIPEDAKVIILTAGFRAEKNHAGAIRALSILHQTYQDKAYLLFVGDGHLSKEIKSQAEDSPVNRFIRFAGLQKDVRPYYWASDLFTLCSNSVETFSIAALEAMSCGLPAVLTDIGGANEMIVTGRNGFLCQPTDEDIANKWHMGLEQKFSAADIHQHVENSFSLEKMIEAYKVELEITD